MQSFTGITTALFIVFTLSTKPAFCQPSAGQHPLYRHFIGRSAFSLQNVNQYYNSFYQVHYGYWLSRKDVISAEFKTRKYNRPLGIPFGPSFGSKAAKYPGTVQEFGIGFGYQRFLWKGLYASVHAMPLFQAYHDEANNKADDGFELLITSRIGYHISFFKNRVFVEPSLAASHWPVRTDPPAAFAAKESRWPNYFLFEPGLHFGVKF